MTTLPRPEHPRPQLVRERWLNLNGEWQFEIDRGDSGLERGLLERDLAQTILVPYAPESVASGIGDTDFLHAVWYRRTVEIPWDAEVLLHFGAVDHDATVWVDGVEVARHRGGFTSFSADLGTRRKGQEITIVVRARDLPQGPQARGKQSVAYANATCLYTRTTGIWQTVWLEAVPADRIESLRITPRPSAFEVETVLRRTRPGLRLSFTLSDADGVVATATAGADDELAPAARLVVPEDRRRLWQPGHPHLYDFRVSLHDTDDNEVDRVGSYAGLRSISIAGAAILINGERVFQRLVLDQGLWPDTLMTAPSDAALEEDIRLSMAAGFNGARLHQKVFEERFLYHADRLGYLVWGEFGDWGAAQSTVDGDPQQPTASYVTQWVEAVQRDRNHPSIVGWCPLNETWQALHDRITQLDDVTRAMYLATKAADPTRPVLDASGYSHRVPVADVYDSHLYEQDPVEFHRILAGKAYVNEHDGRTISLPYAGQPYFVSEYGGIWWNAGRVEDADDPDRLSSWGYGQRVRDLEEWFTRFAGLTDVLLDDPRMFGYCYTQLTDTFQEQNGVYDARRRPKFDIGRLRAVQSRPAAFEE
ncbi:glycoside hydrolase family 2 TIM barrel-domain containing protein [Actinoplanes sp. NPDC089786]|uniref:glycoside hydrolase family 2 protein n=1 Tax=Actinoplanes sp. NPDC089786 TaxID=3155185 RepID=UPI00341D6A70